MSGNVKLALTLLVVVFLGYWIIKIFVAAVLSLLIPLAVIGTIAYVLYLVISRKALGGGRRILP